MVVSLQDDCLRLLIQVGFTETQAKIYLALSTIGQTDAKNLAKQANVPRQATYRTLGELQEKGIVEKIITIPQQYKAVSFSDGLSIMISIKAKEYAQITEKAKEFLLKFEMEKQAQESEKDYNISILEGKETIINRIGTLTSRSNVEICVCQTLQRWIHVNTESVDIVLEALKRGVKYRTVIENTEGEISVPKEVKAILKHPNYQIKVIRDKLKINAALYDDNRGLFSFYPAKSISDSPVIVTNHPSLLVGFRDHFENLWRDSEKLDLKGIFK